MNYKLNRLIIFFNNEIAAWEPPLLRGGVLGALAGNADVLFHNHYDDTFRYQYPLIQYKRIHGKACLVCIREGTEKIGQFFALDNLHILMGERQVNLEIERILPRVSVVKVWNTSFRYHLSHWVPFNSKNYKAYISEEGQIERLDLLRRILIGNILSFAKGVGIDLEDIITCKILKLEDPFRVKVKDAHTLCFDMEFTCNVSLPDYIGLGRHSSIGFGIITQSNTFNNNITEE